LEEGKLIDTLTGHEDSVNAIALTPNGGTIVSWKMPEIVGDG